MRCDGFYERGLSILTFGTKLRFKDIVAQKYADLVYNGLWFSQLKESLDAFVD